MPTITRDVGFEAASVQTSIYVHVVLKPQRILLFSSLELAFLFEVDCTRLTE